MKMLTIKKDMSVSLIGLGLKADEHRFRKRASDVLGQLLEQIKRDEKKGLLIEQAP